MDLAADRAALAATRSRRAARLGSRDACFLLAALPLAMSALTAHEQMFFLSVLVLGVYAIGTPALAHAGNRKPLTTFLLTLSGAAAIELLLPRSAWVLAFFMIFFG